MELISFFFFSSYLEDLGEKKVLFFFFFNMHRITRGIALVLFKGHKTKTLVSASVVEKRSNSLIMCLDN